MSKATHLVKTKRIQRYRRFITRRTYRPMCGENVSRTAARLCAIARQHRSTWRASFNGIALSATPSDLPNDIVAAYTAECDRRHREWEASPEGQAAKVRQEEHDRRAAASAAEGIRSFSLKDADGWAKTVAANTDGYGACGMRYAARWANMAEAAMVATDRTETTSEIIERTSNEADTEGITGFMHGCAVSILSQVWTHGDAMLAWKKEKK
jgi:hypothetical protein